MARKAEGGAARERILALFLARIGEKIDKSEIIAVAQISEWARRVRELRDEFGYQILSHKDRPQDLKPGEYLLLVATARASAKQRKIAKDQWYRILERDGHRCCSCGRKAGDTHPLDPNRRITLVVDHTVPISEADQYGTDPYSDDNLQTLCDLCNEGKSNKYIGKVGQTTFNLTALVRHAALEEQQRIYQMLKTIFEPSETGKQ
jgi:HNH endonuclease